MITILNSKISGGYETLTYGFRDIMWYCGVCMECVDPTNWVFQKFSLDETGGLYYTMQAVQS